MRVDYMSKMGAILGSLFGGSSSTYQPTLGGHNHNRRELLPTKNVAIIGAGAGGSSTAYYLRQYLSHPSFTHHQQLSLTVFDKSSHIGGRCTIVQNIPVPGGSLPNDEVIEQGASIFVSINLNLVRAAKAFHLKSKSQEGELMSIWDGEKFVFEESPYTVVNFVKAIRRWHFAPVQLRKLLRTSINNLLDSYKTSQTFNSISEFMTTFNLANTASLSAKHFLENNTIGKLYSDEIIEAATRVNYGSNLEEIHALGALVTMAANNALQVKGGNFQIFEGMIGASKANVCLETSVTKVRQLSDGRYEVTTVQEGSGRTSKAVFDAVVVASPIGLSNIEFLGIPQPRIPKVNYRTIHATFVKGHLNPEYFGLKDTKEIPAHVLTTKKVTDFTSVSVQTVLENGETITKLFSPEPILEEVLDRLYLERSWVYKKTWLAYPELKALEFAAVEKDEKVQEWGKVELAPGLFYVNAFEPLISTMETETIAGKNVARLVRDQFLGYCPVVKVKSDPFQ